MKKEREVMAFEGCLRHYPHLVQERSSKHTPASKGNLPDKETDVENRRDLTNCVGPSLRRRGSCFEIGNLE